MFKFRKSRKNTSFSKKQYIRLLNNMTEGCQIIGFDWRYLYVNDAVVRHGNQSKDKLLGGRIVDLYPGIEETNVFKAMRLCMEQREPQSLENEFTYPDGSKGWFNLTIQPAPEGIFITSIDITDLKKAENDKEKLIDELQNRLEEINTLQGFIPICSNCKKIRDDKGYWQQLEQYIQKHSAAKFSHSLCPDCARKLYPQIDPHKKK